MARARKSFLALCMSVLIHRDNASAGSLSDWGITYREAPLNSNTLGVDYDRLDDSITANTRVTALLTYT